MAVVKLGPLINDIRGSIGELTYANWRGQTVVKKKAPKVTNPSTEAQARVRRALTEISKKWRQLPPGLKAAWDSYARSIAPGGKNEKQASGQLRPYQREMMTGFNAMCAANLIARFADPSADIPGAHQIDIPPTGRPKPTIPLDTFDPLDIRDLEHMARVFDETLRFVKAMGTAGVGWDPWGVMNALGWQATIGKMLITDWMKYHPSSPVVPPSPGNGAASAECAATIIKIEDMGYILRDLGYNELDPNDNLTLRRWQRVKPHHAYVADSFQLGTHYDGSHVTLDGDIYCLIDNYRGSSGAELPLTPGLHVEIQFDLISTHGKKGPVGPKKIFQIPELPEIPPVTVSAVITTGAMMEE